MMRDWFDKNSKVAASSVLDAIDNDLWRAGAFVLIDASQSQHWWSVDCSSMELLCFARSAPSEKVPEVKPLIVACHKARQARQASTASSFASISPLAYRRRASAPSRA